MSKPSIQQVESAFHHIASLAPDRRAAALDALGDSNLRHEVAQLLDADASAEQFLDAGISRDDEPRLSDPAPASIGAYAVEGILGRGGMGVVYRARDPRLGRAVALKTLSSRVSADSSAVERLRREARSLAAFSHPNIASIHGLEEDGDRFYLVLELVPGVSLASRLLDGPMGWREAVPILQQLAEALEAAHDHGVVHRDVKPSNVMVDADGRVKLLDFGLAKPFGPWERSKSQSLTAQHSLVGTCAYMSPEQLRGDKVDGASDIWAFGCVAFELLTGRRLFSGATPVETVGNVLNEPIVWSALPGEIPGALRRLIERCLQRRKRDRLRHIGDARLELSEVAAESGSASWSVMRRVPRPVSRRAVRAAAWVGLGALVALLAMQTLRNGPEPVGSAPSTIRFTIEVDKLSPGDLQRFAVAPDGASILVGTRDLQVRHLNRLDWQPLVTGLEMRNPFFFPADGAMGYWDGRGISRLPRQGGLPVSVMKPDAGAVGPLGIAAAMDGRLIYTQLWSGPLFQYMDGREEPLTRLDPSAQELSHRWPHLLPDERSLLFVIKDADLESFSAAKIAHLDLETGHIEVLPEPGTAPSYLPTGHLLFCRHNSLIGVGFDPGSGRLLGAPKVLVDGVYQNSITGVCWYDVSPTGTLAYMESHERARSVLKLWEPSGESRDLITTPRGEDSFFHSPVFSADGRSVLVTVARASTEIWRHDLERGSVVNLTRGMGNAYAPAWSPDGRRMAFIQEILGIRSLVVMSTDGTRDPEVLAEDPELLGVTSWSDDGRFIFIDTGVQHLARHIGVFDLQSPGDGGVRRVGSGPVQRSNAKLSPDGRWLAYSSTETGRRQIEIGAFPELDRRLQVRAGEGNLMAWAGPRELLVIADHVLRRITVSLDGDMLSVSGTEALTTVGAGENQAGDRTTARVLSTVFQPRRVPPERRGNGEIQVVVGWHHEVRAAFDDTSK